MSGIQITHVIDCLGDGGAARALLANAREWQRQTAGRNRIVSLLPATRSALDEARAMDASVLQAPAREVLLHALSESDIVQVHFFNAPALFQMLASRLPPCRMLLWCHVGGGTAPHFLTDAVVDLADRLVVTAPISLSLHAVQQLNAKGNAPCVVIGGADLARLEGLEPRPHARFNVGYIGTLDPAKIHPDFVAMSCRVDVPDIRFIVCGAQEQKLRSQAETCGMSDRFEFRGYVRNIRPVLEALDVFGYPLCPDTYATSDQALQEAMFAGVPPIIFPYGGIRDMVSHNKTGIIVDSPIAYADAIRYLARHPQERARLGHNARAYAAKHFGAARTARLFDGIYRTMLADPKRERAWLAGQTDGDGQCTMSGVELFLLSLAGRMPEFEIGAAGKTKRDACASDRIIAKAAPAVAAVVRQYLAYFRFDPMLAMWAGLMDRETGYHARALIEFRHALANGGDELRLKSYIAEAVQALGASKEAVALASVYPDAPNSAPIAGNGPISADCRSGRK